MQKKRMRKHTSKIKEKHLKISAAYIRAREINAYGSGKTECREKLMRQQRIYFNLKERIQSVKREEVRDELTDLHVKYLGKKVFRELEKKRKNQT
ncbi:MAG: hypothetical protein ACLVIY_07575 [Anaerobutyricum soehngenii]